MSTEIIDISPKFVRTNDAWIGGVCSGLAKLSGIDALVIRLGWIISFFFFGIGLPLYIFALISFPKEGQAFDRSNKVLGVCQKLSLKTGVEVGLIRFASLFLLVSSFGVVSLAYFVLFFLMPDEN